MKRRSKIMITLGPSSEDDKTLRRLLQAGADAIRLNLSHGTREHHRQLVRRVRKVADQLGRQVPIMLDLMGPRYRLGDLSEEGRQLKSRQLVTLASEPASADVPIGNPDLLRYLKPGERVLIGDGLIELRVLERKRDRVRARVNSGGRITSRKGINLPDSDLPFRVSDKDRGDIQMAVEEGIDILAASYVGRGSDIKNIHRQIGEAGGAIPVLAKLERARAIEHIDEIVDAADAVMVARGDLGVEVPLHRVPVLQKKIIAAGRRAGKPVVVATQMLESMIRHPRPTRAEASDVANTVFDGTDTLLLTGETAIGSHPGKTVRTMVKIIEEAENYALSIDHSWRNKLLVEPESGGFPEVADAAAKAAVLTAQNLAARQIVAFSRSGFTARLIARYRPSVPVLVFTPEPGVARQIQLLWGVQPIAVTDRRPASDDEVVELVERALKKLGLVKNGERLVILMGSRVGDRRPTNLMRIHQVRS